MCSPPVGGAKGVGVSSWRSNPQLQKQVPRTWNVTSLARKEPELACEPQKFRPEVVGIESERTTFTFIVAAVPVTVATPEPAVRDAVKVKKGSYWAFLGCLRAADGSRVVGRDQKYKIVEFPPQGCPGLSPER